MLKWFIRLAAVCVAAGLLPSPAVASIGHSGDGLDAVRDATGKFHNVANATKANYASFLSCFDQPGTGGMGQHYVNFSILDTSLDPTQPEALVYEIDGSTLTLVGVEYLVPISAWSSPVPPSLFNQNFYRNDDLGVYYLHAWIWRSNPAGVFANYNANVKLCPGH